MMSSDPDGCMRAFWDGTGRRRDERSPFLDEGVIAKRWRDLLEGNSGAGEFDVLGGFGATQIGAAATTNYG
jgi:hypothetical protein